jgi:hypothetical protein
LAKVKSLKFSAFQFGALAFSTIVGFIVGSSFMWANPEKAWNFFLAGFLWVLIISAGTGLARCVRERIQRGEWWRGLAVGCEMTFPTTTMYMLTVALASAGAVEATTLANGASLAVRPDMLLIAPVFYAVALAMAVFIGPVFMLTSPFGKNHSS